MSLAKETEISRIEIVQTWFIQVRTDTIVKENGTEISRTVHRHMLEPFTSKKDGDTWTHTAKDISGEDEQIQQGYQGVSSVDQQRVADTLGTGEVQAASVQDELSTLMSQFDDGQTPAWAAGSMRRANQIMAQRGLSASSMAGQAVIQAAMEAALPIAQIDAGNKQQMALFKAEQRA